MKFLIDDLLVSFPYPHVYPEQYQYMKELKRILDSDGHAILEMPTGTGKTVCLLSLILSYIKMKKPSFKLVYCTRTIVEMEKTLDELKFVMDSRDKDFSSPMEPEILHQLNKVLPPGEEVPSASQLKSPILAMCLSSRKNLCINEKVNCYDEREKVDSECRARTATWVRDRVQTKKQDNGVEEVKAMKPTKAQVRDIEDLGELCSFYEGFQEKVGNLVMPNGIYTLDDLKKFGKKQGMCPYYLARHYLIQSNVIVYNYSYMLDPKISNLVSAELQRDCIVVFDECHNIDNACIEAFSMNLNRKTLELASSNIKQLEDKVKDEKVSNTRRLHEEYTKLVKGIFRLQGDEQAQAAMKSKNLIVSEKDLMAHPLLEQDVLKEAVPGTIRKAEHFLSFMRRVLVCLKDILNKTYKVQILTPLKLLYTLQDEFFIDQRSLKFAHERLQSLLNTLEISNMDEFRAISIVADFSTLLSTYFKGFTVIIEPYPDDNIIYDPLMQFYCLDASLATKPLFAKYRNVILTSGTISPIEMYPKILDFTPKVMKAFDIALPRNAIQPLIVTRGADLLPISSRFEDRENAGNIRNYGNLLVELSQVVPDGIVCFFTSYRYMEHIILKWDEMRILEKIRENKLIYIETKDHFETILALENYKQACDNGRGAVFFSIARGKVSEGVDFAGHYGRAVVMFGIPYQNTLSRNLRARMQYLNDTFQIRENEFLTFDAMRQCSQCVGRVLRSKYDYGMMIFADARFQRSDKMDKFPVWIKNQMEMGTQNMSVDTAVNTANAFFKEMGQPFTMPKNYLYDQGKLMHMNLSPDEMILT